MAVSEIGDPRLKELFGPGAAKEPGVRPVIELPRSGPSGWVIAGFICIAAMLLFWALESRRHEQSAPDVRERGPSSLSFSLVPPPLYIPPAPPPEPSVAAPTEHAEAELEPRPRSIRAPSPTIIYREPVPQQIAVPSVQQSRASSGPPLVIDTTAQATRTEGESAARNAHGGQTNWGGRARAGALARPSTTVAQGALIPAVLETAFSSTNAGLARAIVSRDVRAFDGTKILIPRGSRLIGEYQADVAPGQNRALITWTRLICPDGTTMALDSPATDTLGRGGIRASVNSHFWGRLGDALLRTTVEVGSGIATRALTGGVFVAVPGSSQQSSSEVQMNRFVPTLSIPAGKSISVFVARDLEFPDKGGAE